MTSRYVYIEHVVGDADLGPASAGRRQGGDGEARRVVVEVADADEQVRVGGQGGRTRQVHGDQRETTDGVALAVNRTHHQHVARRVRYREHLHSRRNQADMSATQRLS